MRVGRKRHHWRRNIERMPEASVMKLTFCSVYFVFCGSSIHLTPPVTCHEVKTGPLVCSKGGSLPRLPCPLGLQSDDLFATGNYSEGSV